MEITNGEDGDVKGLVRLVSCNVIFSVDIFYTRAVIVCVLTVNDSNSHSRQLMLAPAPIITSLGMLILISLTFFITSKTYTR